MATPISSNQLHRIEGVLDGCHHVHAAGQLPNSMNRFLRSYLQKVLFVY